MQQAPHSTLHTGGLIDAAEHTMQTPQPPVAPVPAAQPINFYDALRAYKSSY